MSVRFEIAETTIDVGLQRRLLGAHDTAGAVASFEGWVRNHHQGREVLRLEYHAHPRMATPCGQALLEEIAKAHGLLALHAVHRVGTLEVGEVAVWIAACAPHRAEAFLGCRVAIDRIKEEVPIWKREHHPNNDFSWFPAVDVKSV